MDQTVMRIHTTRLRRYALFSLIWIVALSASIQSQQKTSVEKPRPKLSIPDVEVLNQDGRKLNFYTDVVKGKVVVINFVFTSCKAICPLSGAHFSKLQAALGERLGRDVFLVSVSTDPKTDSPKQLKTWAAQFKPQAGWTLITGQEKEIAQVLRALKGDGLNTYHHVPSLCIIDDEKKTHRWAYGLEPADSVIKMIAELGQDRSPQPASQKKH